MKHTNPANGADGPQQRSASPDPSFAQPANDRPAQVRHHAAMHQRLLQLQNAMGANSTSGTRFAQRAPVDVLASLSSKSSRAPGRPNRQLTWLVAPVLLGTALWWGLPALWTFGSRLSIQQNVQTDSASGVADQNPLPAQTPQTANENQRLASEVAKVETPAVAPVLKPEPLPETAAPAVASPAAEAPPAEALRLAVEQWRQAWAARDVDAYLAQYAQTFVPANGQSRARWADSRRRIISRQNSIAVSLSNMEVHATGADRWQARFLQDYTADNFSEKQLPKQLDFVREDGQWRIAAERSGPG